jgi:RNA polymerase sigma-70 factor (ECF subfamily)
MAEAAQELLPTRTSLLERLKDWQDDPSWREFFGAYRKLIYGFALHSGLTEAGAQDVLQETMFSVAKHIPNFKYNRELGSFKRWLLNMTRWRIRDQFRRRENLAPLPEEDQMAENQTPWIEKVPDPASLQLEEIWQAEWEKNLLEVATEKVRRKLDPRKFQIFECLIKKQWPPEKVAKMFDMPVAGVYRAKHKVSELIKEEIKHLDNGLL